MVSAVEIFTPFTFADEGKKHLTRKQCNTTKRFACVMVASLLVLAIFSSPHLVSAEMVISGLTPSSGPVGTIVELTANITTVDGDFEVFFDGELVANGTAQAATVLTNFTVPKAPAGNHTVRILDPATNDNATETFTVTTSYFIGVTETEKLFQESDFVPVCVNIEGGEAGRSYSVNMTVVTPSNFSYAKTVDVAVSDIGNGSTTANFPGDFSVDANTSLVGIYRMFFNTSLAQGNFSVGLTNSTEYHRNQVVNIKALYGPEENVTLTIRGLNVDTSVNLTDPSGIISYDWTVPVGAAIATYTVNLFSVSGATRKTPSDLQTFVVPGFAVNVTAKNLASDPVQGLTIRAYEGGSHTDTVTSENGSATLKLEVGNYSVGAYLKEEKVGGQDIEISEAAAFDLVCNLTNLRVLVVAVVDGDEIDVPEAGLLLMPDNKTYTTDINGTVVMRSLLPNMTYGMNLTRYGSLFNVTSLSTLFVNDAMVPWFNVTVRCPILTLQVETKKAGGQPLSNALVRIQETLGSPRLESHTDGSGVASFDVPFGTYTVQIYDANGVRLNDTVLNVFENINVTVPCDLYGLTVSVKIVDYFGQGIANLNVKLGREGQTVMSTSTQSDGVAAFNEVVGGNLQIAVFMGDSSQPVAAQGFLVENSKMIELKIARYVVLAGMIVEASQLVTVVIVVLAAVLIIGFEILRRRRLGTQAGET